MRCNLRLDLSVPGRTEHYLMAARHTPRDFAHWARVIELKLIEIMPA